MLLNWVWYYNFFLCWSIYFRPTISIFETSTHYVVSFAAVFRNVTQLRDTPKDGCQGDQPRLRRTILSLPGTAKIDLCFGRVIETGSVRFQVILSGTLVAKHISLRWGADQNGSEYIREGTRLNTRGHQSFLKVSKQRGLNNEEFRF